MAKTNVRGGQIADGANGVDLTVDVTGTLPAANGGTGVTSLGALAANLVPAANNTYDLGGANYWNNVYSSSAWFFSLNLFQNNSPFTGRILLQNNSTSTDKVITFPDASGIADIDQFITLTSTYTLANQTAAQKLFNSPTNGAVTLPANTTYFFECCFTLSSLSASAHSFGFAFGGTATLTRQAWWADAVGAAPGTATASLRTFNTAAQTTLITAGNTATTASATIKGKIVVGTGGTLIPQVSQLTNAAAAVVGVDSYFRIWAVGANTVQSAGAWS